MAFESGCFPAAGQLVSFALDQSQDAPKSLRPHWFMGLGLFFFGVFYLGLAVLVFYIRVLPAL